MPTQNAVGRAPLSDKTPSAKPRQPLCDLGVLTEQLTHLCPGETSPISEAVHKARWESGFPACKRCPHSPLASHQEAPEAPPRCGFRGKLLDTFDSQAISVLAARFAHSLHRQEKAPRVIVGIDSSFEAAELRTGLNALSQFGCEVIDVGSVPRSVFDFSVRDLNASGGLYLTLDPNLPGYALMTTVGRGAVPWSQPGTLEALPQIAARPVRKSLPVHSYRPAFAYAGQFRRFLHALRPLRIAITLKNHWFRDVLTQIFEETPCRITFPEDQNRLNPAWPQAASLQDLHVLISADGRALDLASEDFRIVPREISAKTLGADSLGSSYGLSTDNDETLWEMFANLPSNRVFDLTNGLVLYKEGETVFCDALMQLVLTIQKLSESDRLASRVFFNQ